MTKAELVEQIVKSSKAGNLNKKEAKEIIDIIFKAVRTSIEKNERFAYKGFGTFTVRKRAARRGRNPRTGDTIRIKASKIVRFKPAPSLQQGLSLHGDPTTEAPPPKRRRRR
jgi:DNA-binding protein HU-beta